MVAILKICKNLEFLQSRLETSKNKLMKCELIFRLDNPAIKVSTASTYFNSNAKRGPEH